MTKAAAPSSSSTTAAPSAPSAGIILDSDLVPEGISRSFVRLPGEDLAEFHLRVTHLHFERQNIRQIGDLVSDGKEFHPTILTEKRERPGNATTTTPYKSI